MSSVPLPTIHSTAEELADRVPTIDDNPDVPPQVDYKDWRTENTRVVVYTTDPAAWPKDRPAKSPEDAAAQCRLAHGKILEIHQVPGRIFFRVDRRVK